LFREAASGKDSERSTIESDMFHLTREQQMLAAMIVLLFLTGLGVKYWRAKNPPAHVSRVQSANPNASR
jgi:hypothetical protein